MPEADRERTSTTAPSRDGATGGSFPATQWSVVLRAGHGVDTHARAALESLCRRYWRPLYVFVRRQGRTHQEAEDCVQEFFAHLLSSEGLQRAQPERGRFRNFLLRSLRNFLTSEWRRAHTLKRGGGAISLPLATAGAEESFCAELIDPGLTPEQAFDHNWALGLLERAGSDLRAEFHQHGRGALFDVLAPLIWGRSLSESLAEPAQRAGLEPRAFALVLHRARRRFGDRLRAAVAETVADPAEIDEELRHLINALKTRPTGEHG